VSNVDVNRGRLLLTLVLATTLCDAAPRCPDPRLRLAIIGGDTITGSVLIHKKPLKFAQVRLYFSSGTAAWSGRTDKNGSFAINKMLPGVYRLEVSGWGTTLVQLKPELNKGPFGQTPAWNLMLIDNACVAVTEILN
jgi:hypothetical protein